MATVTRENIGNLHDKLIITVTKEDYNTNFENTVKQYSKTANIPGFRKGMVPVGMVKSMYGKDLFADAVIKSVEKSLFEYMDTEKLEIFAQPMASEENNVDKLDYKSPADYQFSFEIGLRPVVVTPNLGDAKLKAYQVTITDEMITESLENQQRRLGELKDEDAITDGDNVLNVTFYAIQEGVVAEEGKTNSLLVKYFSDAYQPKLIGMQVDATIDLVLAEAFNDKELEYVLQDLGLTVDNANSSYQLKITKIGRVIHRELDEKFFADAFPGAGITDEAGGRAALLAEQEGYWKQQTNNQLHDAIYHYLVDNTNMAFPEEFLKKWMREGREKPSTTEEVEAEYPKFVESLKWTIISDSLIQKNTIKATAEDIREYAKAQIMGYMGGQINADNASWIDGYADRMMQDKKFVEETHHRVLTSKLFAWTETQVTPTVEPITVEAFTEMVSKHQH
jgi:trigger factor